MKNIIVSIVICGITLTGYGQKNVKISSSSAIESLMDRFAAEGKAEETIKGWRIQIVTTNDRHEMEAAQATFIAMYPGVNIDWKHVAPYYQVRVGYFENKNKLMPLLLELKKTFPSATYIYDQVTKRSMVH
jgi:hypothetical protein